MKKLFSLSLYTLLVMALTLTSSTAFAARPAAPTQTTDINGYDVSYIQCGKTLPTDHYFGIVGVNGGAANKANPCLAPQLTWASTAKNGSRQPKVQLYVNTANPGEVISQVDTWPTSPKDNSGMLPNNPYGDTCTGANDLACSWLYGWNRSLYTETVFRSAVASTQLTPVPSSYVWWLDIETMNTWQAGSSDALKRNVAALEGFAAYYQKQRAAVGLYSTEAQWNEITGDFLGASSNLHGLANWRPSGTSLKNAKNNCSVAPLTSGGYIALTQYVQKNLDHDYSCL